MSESTAFAKTRLRTELRGRLQVLSADHCAELSSSIRAHIVTSLSNTDAKRTVAVFGGIKGEPDLEPLIAWIHQQGGRAVCFGFTDGQLLPQVVTSADELERGVFGVWVPHANCPVIDPGELDIILTPGLGFDRFGHRLGRGRGYFDRLFAHPRMKARRLGVGFQFQVVDAIPVEPHDALMEALITENGIMPVQLSA